MYCESSFNLFPIKRKFEDYFENRTDHASQKTKQPKYDRTYPPLAMCDTVMNISAEKLVSIHGQGLCFQDEEIVAIRGRSLPPPLPNNQAEEIALGTTKKGKIILQQQSIRGCTAACVEMLKADNGKSINWSYMRSATLGNTKRMKRQLEKNNLQVITHNVNFQKISKSIEQYGSAIIFIEPGIGGHCVVVDKISYKRNIAYIRDPYHGWAIAITLSAFKNAVKEEMPQLMHVKK